MTGPGFPFDGSIGAAKRRRAIRLIVGAIMGLLMGGTVSWFLVVRFGWTVGAAYFLAVGLLFDIRTELRARNEKP